MREEKSTTTSIKSGALRSMTEFCLREPGLASPGNEILVTEAWPVDWQPTVAQKYTGDRIA